MRLGYSVSPLPMAPTIVFSYAGDLYKAPLNGGEAQKLTSHIGYEMFARFSPDGKSIAFTGQYDGNTEVYLNRWRRTPTAYLYSNKQPG